VKTKFGKDIQIVDFTTYMISPFIDGDLINVDFTFHRDLDQPIIEDIYLRVNDDNYRTYLTNNSYFKADLMHRINDLLDNMAKLMDGYYGRLTADIIVSNGKLTIVEISPFHHKPWLRELCRYEYGCAFAKATEVTTYTNSISHTIDLNSNLVQYASFKSPNQLNGRCETQIYIEKP
jgi:hypothetical protein